MGNQRIDWINITFADHARRSQNSEQMLDLVIASWKEIDRILRSIVGKVGVEALYHRSIVITAQAYPWLAAASTNARSALDTNLLHNVLSKESTSHIASANDTLLLQFYCILTTLIGASLTDRFLRPALDPLLNGTAIKEM